MRILRRTAAVVFFLALCFFLGRDSAPYTPVPPSELPPARMEITFGKGSADRQRALVRVAPDGSRILLWQHTPTFPNKS